MWSHCGAVGGVVRLRETSEDREDVVRMAAAVRVHL
jgi:hypothetical protein